LRLAAHAALRFVSRQAPQHLMGQFDWLYKHDVTNTARRTSACDTYQGRDLIVQAQPDRHMVRGLFAGADIGIYLTV
mgnify:CR=1